MMRILALGGVIGPALFVAIVIVSAALRPDYSHPHSFISELGATGTPRAWLMNYLGFVPTGLMLAGFGVSMKMRMPRHPLITLGALLLVFFGVGVAMSGFFSCDIGCPRTGGSLQNLIHDRLAPLLFASGSLGAVFLGIRFRSCPQLRPFWGYSIVSGILGFCLLAAVASTLESREFTGLWQRLLIAVLFGWCAVIGLRIFREDAVA